MKTIEPVYQEMITEKDAMVPMSDGVGLATDIYRPARNGMPESTPLPVLMERTPYGKSDAPRVEQAEYFTSYGYVVVFQDCRGRFNSEGTFTKYVNEGRDGYDTVEWLAAQPWCDGKVGTFGISYGTHTQTSMACLNPPHLACMFQDSGGFFNAYLNACRTWGAFELRQATWAFTQACNSPEAQRDPVIRKALQQTDIRDWFKRIPWKEDLSPLKWISSYEDYLLELWSHSEPDDYWRQVGLSLEHYLDDCSDVPMVYMSSWYDIYSWSGCQTYVELSKRKRGPIHLVMGPWLHGRHDLTFTGDVDFGKDATLQEGTGLDYNQHRLEWFDRHLKGVAPRADKTPPLAVFVMGGGDGRRDEEGRMRHGGHWRHEQEWPLARTDYTPFYFHSNGTLDMTLPAANDPPSEYDYDPRHPVPTIGGSISAGAPVMDGGAFDQREEPRFFGSTEPYLPLSSRLDVVVFQTQVLEEDVEITGPILVKLWVSSSAPDTDFTGKLVDVCPPNEDYPKGFDLNLTDGIMRARFRNSWDKPELMNPNEAYEIELQLYPTSNLFKAGHRIRLDISSSNFPRFDPNPNTGEPLGRNRRALVAHNTIYHDSAQPSHVLLPVIPA
jgi:putative CocE/NonD family hydrolase